ncbi:hypothetical protein FGK63_01370 [Ruegeria sediminis]|uniref:AbiV family abortive infection protein n=1 Tax=Ruegeria sediminis TaxID=2583820 RepID=A0ABY2X4L3_9RHOB|nr:hypothetical protein [Ruegeria sediminis]TMV09747.1 hypothetical protein FGK63_01370 [Ruegeria sediminis]
MSELSDLLLKDFEAFDERLTSAANQAFKFQGLDERYLIISAASFIEAILAEAASRLFDLHVSPNFFDLGVLAVNGKTLGVKKNGEVEFRDLRLDNKTKFKAIARAYSIFDVTYAADFNSEGWEHVLHTTETRNRLLHPKKPEDLELIVDDLVRANKAVTWIYARKIEWMKIKINVLDQAVQNRNALVRLFYSSDEDPL